MKKQRGVTERKMMGGLTFMTASGMFCSASGKGGLLVRVAPESRDRFLAESHVQPADIERTSNDGLYPDRAGGLPHRSRSEKMG